MFHIIIWDVDGDGEGGAVHYLAKHLRGSEQANAIGTARDHVENQFAAGAAVFDENLKVVKLFGMTNTVEAVEYIRSKQNAAKTDPA